MLDGALILWFILTFFSLIYAAISLFFYTPSQIVMKFGWLLVILYTGPLGLFIFLLTCREPLPYTHEQFIKPLWKQALGSEIHCVAGDATGIIISAIIISFFTLSGPTEMIIEYIGGFSFGWFIFQALFMRDMFGGSYLKSLKKTFMPEWLSMNMIMAGMIPAMFIWRHFDSAAANVDSLAFWGSMSLATIVGGLIAYPMNVWLVAKGLKHGMSTVRKGHQEPSKHAEHHMQMPPTVSKLKLFMMTLLTLIVLSIGIGIIFLVH